MSVLNICNIGITDMDYHEIIHDAHNSTQSPYIISTFNVPLVKFAKDQIKYRRALNHSTITIPDGIGIVWASKILYGKSGLKQRVTGPDLFLEYCRVANQRNLSFFFLGSTPAILAKIKSRLLSEFPGITRVDVFSPPFGDWGTEMDDRIIKSIEQANPDILWVGMTAPKQELWVFENKDRLRVKVVAAVGAAFDFYARTRPRAPMWMQRLGLEWFHRVCQEPWRVGKRYLSTIPYFIIQVFAAWLTIKKKAKRGE